ncbi:hypothetical protein LAC81_15890 [Ensifer adhaerens]|uniref:hypothetical protein n=1 Tax=Ensifer adhaerens TaxID=106592 RepID=UPI001CC138B4|nr:hypothetical protein [Ensifer adhaerens]MBZ7923272.1 hypothetical protein [Ensifer adhaerens]UAX91849.1 hypothetical protein LAC78_15885 [Ensifer adhaerens]UAX99477.1 hypothetical protein LAC80_15890 [Ensifer adhaerens]UAY06860.1 hypothetical protein LAC81_15890 [Ensifer adhaerens]
MSLHDFRFRRHLPILPPEVAPQERPDANEAHPDELDALLLRLTVVRRLREHHVWEAVRVIRELPDVAAGAWPSPRFRELMAADALVDAVIHLTSTTEAKLCLRTLGHELGIWTCALRYQPPGSGRVTYKARHADLAAAILGALLRSCRGHQLAIAATDRGQFPA